MSNDNADRLVHPVLRWFMHGQFANLFKLAFWWVSLAPLVMALTGSATSIGYSRIAYNLALCIFNPLGALLVEHKHPRQILLGAAAARFVVYCVLLPLQWIFFATNLTHSRSDTAVWVITMVMMVIDGIAVALSAILDIDFAGIDIMGGVFQLDISDDHRNQFNTRNELFFAVCFIVFAPAMAFAGYGMKRMFTVLTERGSISANALGGEDGFDAGALSAAFFATFLLTTVVQYWFFRKLRPEAVANGDAADVTVATAGGDDARTRDAIDTTATDYGSVNAPRMEEQTHENADLSGDSPPSLAVAARSVPGDLLLAMQLICANKPILWRLLFFGFELAFEDAMIVVIGAQVGLREPWLGNGDAVQGNIWTSCGVASGKLGGAIASFALMKWYVPPEQPKKLFWLFLCIFASCVAVVGFPLVVAGQRRGTLSDDAARAVFLGLFFVYFFLSTLPKLGLMNLLQSLVASVENGHRAFGFIAVIATAIDSAVVMGLSATFVTGDVLWPLWICAIVYGVHGLLELVLGPYLVLRPLQHQFESAASVPAAASPCAPKPADGSEGLTTPLVTPSGPRDDEVATYTQKSVTVPVRPAEGAAVMSSSKQQSAMMASSASASGAVVVHRRRSQLDSSRDEAGSYTRVAPMTPRSPRSARLH